VSISNLHAAVPDSHCDFVPSRFSITDNSAICELRSILNPADVHGPDFPGENFRVLKEKELAKFGEYRTRRLVLEARDKLSPL